MTRAGKSPSRSEETGCLRKLSSFLCCAMPKLRSSSSHQEAGSLSFPALGFVSYYRKKNEFLRHLFLLSWRCFSVNKTVERYLRKVKDRDLGTRGSQANTQEGAVNMTKKIENLEVLKRKLLGDGLDTCFIDELRQIEKQLEQSLTKIRARKNQLFKEQIEKLREEEKRLLGVNKELREQCGDELQRWNSPEEQDVEHLNEKTDGVETDLVIGPPERRMP